jgi:hypothetical protein
MMGKKEAGYTATVRKARIVQAIDGIMVVGLAMILCINLKGK